MTYYQANTDSEDIICDPCGEKWWDIHPTYGTNTDARDQEKRDTGIQWNWVPVYSSTPMKCYLCGKETR